MLKTLVSLGLVLGALGSLSLVSGNAMPVYGTTRYRRPAWAYRAPPPTYVRQPYPYPEDLYYQPDPIVHYPYYPVARPYSEGDAYQNLYPYYYNDRLRPYPYYGKDDSYQSTDQIQDSSRDDVPRGRSEALPVGQETWFENEPTPRWQSEYDDVNAAFLQNLIMSQMYNDALDKNGEVPSDERDHHPEVDDYDERRSADYYGERDTRDFEDEDVRELKALAGKPLYHVPKTDVFTASGKNKDYRQQWHADFSTQAPPMAEPEYIDDYPSDEGWINWGSKRSEKKIAKSGLRTKGYPTSTAGPTSTTVPSTARPGAMSGQKEVVLLRPATPVRHPFPEPVMQMLAANSVQLKRNPSVYDTIKQLLSMDESFKPNSDNKARMQKRFVTTEDELVGELRGLKRRSPA